MAKRQTRRSISVKGITYQRLQNYCSTHQQRGMQKLSVSGYLEELIAAAMDVAKVPVPEQVTKRPPRLEPDEKIVSQHFTF